MRTIKGFTPEDRTLLYIAVNSPSGKEGFTVDDAIKVKEVMDILKDGIEPDEQGNLNFEPVGKKDVVVKEYQYTIIKEAITTMKWRTAEIAIKAISIKEKVDNAEKSEDKK